MAWSHIIEYEGIREKASIAGNIGQRWLQLAVVTLSVEGYTEASHWHEIRVAGRRRPLRAIVRHYAITLIDAIIWLASVSPPFRRCHIAFVTSFSPRLIRWYYYAPITFAMLPYATRCFHIRFAIYAAAFSSCLPIITYCHFRLPYISKMPLAITPADIFFHAAITYCRFHYATPFARYYVYQIFYFLYAEASRCVFSGVVSACKFACLYYFEGSWFSIAVTSVTRHWAIAIALRQALRPGCRHDSFHH